MVANNLEADGSTLVKVEIRAVGESELEEMIQLQCMIFRPDGYDRFRGYIHGDSSYRLDQTRVVVVEGKVVTTLRNWERRLRIGSSIVRMAGVGGVGTHPEHRGRGYASALMRDAAESMRQNLGLKISRGTIANVMKEHGLEGAPDRAKRMPGKDDIPWRRIVEARHLGIHGALSQRTKSSIVGQRSYRVLRGHGKRPGEDPAKTTIGRNAQLLLSIGGMTNE